MLIAARSVAGTRNSKILRGENDEKRIKASSLSMDE
jgi:hypothetical protein